MATMKKNIDLWTVIKWLLIALALVFLLIVLTGEADVEPTSAKERAAQFTAQEKYYEMLGLYGDKVGAEQSASLTYEQMMED